MLLFALSRVSFAFLFLFLARDNFLAGRGKSLITEIGDIRFIVFFFGFGEVLNLLEAVLVLFCFMLILF